MDDHRVEQRVSRTEARLDSIESTLERVVTTMERWIQGKGTNWGVIIAAATLALLLAGASLAPLYRDQARLQSWMLAHQELDAHPKVRAELDWLQALARKTEAYGRERHNMQQACIDAQAQHLREVLELKLLIPREKLP